MEIIDAHMHLSVNYSGFIEKKAALLNEMKQNNVSGAIVISDSETVSGIGSMRDCMDLFTDVPNVWAVGGISPLIDFREQLKVLEYGLGSGRLIGIKIYCGHEPIYLDSGELSPVFGLAKKYGVPILFHSGWNDPQYSAPKVIERAAKAHRDVTLICCHCCFPNTKKCFEALAEYENVFFDISSLADSPPLREAIKSSLEKAITALPKRFIFGSDSACCDQAQHIRFAEQLGISSREREMLFSENAESVFKLY